MRCNKRTTYLLGAIHKRHFHKIVKNLSPSPLFAKCLHCLKPLLPLSVRTHYKFRKLRSFLHQKMRTSTSEETFSLCTQNVRTRQTPWLRTSVMDSHLHLTHVVCDIGKYYNKKAISYNARTKYRMNKQAAKVHSFKFINDRLSANTRILTTKSVTKI